jgi:hypothetical protein
MFGKDLVALNPLLVMFVGRSVRPQEPILRTFGCGPEGFHVHHFDLFLDMNGRDCNVDHVTGTTPTAGCLFFFCLLSFHLFLTSWK